MAATTPRKGHQYGILLIGLCNITAIARAALQSFGYQVHHAEPMPRCLTWCSQWSHLILLMCVCELSRGA